MDSVRAAALCSLSTTFVPAPERTREPSARAPTVKEYRKINDITSLVWSLTSTKLLTSFSLLCSFPEVPCYHASAAATDGSGHHFKIKYYKEPRGQRPNWMGLVCAHSTLL